MTKFGDQALNHIVSKTAEVKWYKEVRAYFLDPSKMTSHKKVSTYMSTTGMSVLELFHTLSDLSHYPKGKISFGNRHVHVWFISKIHDMDSEMGANVTLNFRMEQILSFENIPYLFCGHHYVSWTCWQLLCKHTI